MRFRPPGPVAAAALLAALLGVLAPHGAARPAAAEDAASGVDVVEETPAADRTVATNPDAPEWRGRRERLATALGADTVVLVLSHGATRGFTGQVRSDEFFYLCPFEATDAALVLFHAEGAVRHHVYLPPRRAALERWTGPAIGPGEETAREHGFDAARPADSLESDLLGLLASRGRLAVSAASPADGRERLDALIARLASASPADRPLLPAGAHAPAGAPGVRVVPATAAITDLRAVKSPVEVERIRRAVLATVEGLRDAARTVAPGVAEYQVQAVVELRCRLAGCLSQAFDSIVGSGPNSCVLHYMANTRTMAAGELVVVDVGGAYRGYAADVTRTFPVSGTFDARQAEVYDAVLAAQEAGIAAVRPGATLRDVHEAARSVLRERGLDRWFIHGTSHSVGLNVHDPWGRERQLAPGSVLTVEPGVYIPDEALGVRIEDTVLVTEDGALVLSAGVPKDRDGVEALMREPPPIEVPGPR